MSHSPTVKATARFRNHIEPSCFTATPTCHRRGHNSLHKICYVFLWKYFSFFRLISIPCVYLHVEGRRQPEPSLGTARIIDAESVLSILDHSLGVGTCPLTHTAIWVIARIKSGRYTHEYTNTIWPLTSRQRSGEIRGLRCRAHSNQSQLESNNNGMKYRSRILRMSKYPSTHTHTHFQRDCWNPDADLSINR